MEQQVEKLKLNVTNIKNSLFSNNKELKKIEKDKTNLFSRLDKKRTLREEEGRLESKNLGIGSGFSKIASTITSPVKGIFDRILEFFGLIAAGILLQNLPIILKQVEDFFNSDFIKGVGNVLGFIGNGILQLAQFVGLFPKSEQDKIKKDADETNKIIDEDIKNADRAERDIINLEKLLGKSEEDNEPEQSIESPQSEPDKTVTPKEPKEPKEPSDTQKPESTQPITAKNPVQSFNRGGTVKSTPEKLSERQAYQPQKSRQSPEGKKAQRDANNGFINFPIAVDKIIDVTKEHEKNILLYADVLKKDRGLRSGITTTSPTPPGPTIGPPAMVTGGTKPSQAHFNSPVGWRGHPIHGGVKYHTGVDVSMGLGTPVSSAQDAEVIHAGDKGDGYGYSVVLRHTDGAETRYGHFQSVNVKTGQKIKAGQLLGKEGSTGDSTGSHVHFSHYPPGSGGAMSYGGEGVVTVITENNKSFMDSYFRYGGNVKPLGTSGGNGGGRVGVSLGPLNSSRNQSVFIYAVQPVETYVPFPYPMPVETPVASSSPTPQLSSIWRG